MTKLLGLTGSIGTGKSTVSRELSAHGVPIIDADAIAHTLQLRGTDCYNELVEKFGNEIAGEYSIDRKRLGEIVFADPAKLLLLNRTMDIYIRGMILDQIHDYSLKQIDLVVLDAPLLYELGYANYVDLVVMVTCDPTIQVSRLKMRNHISTTQAVRLIGKQWPQSIKQNLADVVINNSGSISQTSQQVLKLLDKLR